VSLNVVKSTKKLLYGYKKELGKYLEIDDKLIGKQNDKIFNKEQCYCYS